MSNIYKNLEVQYDKLFRHIKTGSFKTRERYGKAFKRLQCFIAYHRKSFTAERITFHGLRHTYAHEQYEKFKREGCSDYEARKKVSELLGHHRDDVTRIYLVGGSDSQSRL